MIAPRVDPRNRFRRGDSHDIAALAAATVVSISLRLALHLIHGAAKQPVCVAPQCFGCIASAVMSSTQAETSSLPAFSNTSVSGIFAPVLSGFLRSSSIR